MDVNSTNPDAASFDGGATLGGTLTQNTSEGLCGMSFVYGSEARRSGMVLSGGEHGESCSLSDAAPLLAVEISLDLKREIEAVSIRQMLKSDYAQALRLFDRCYDLYAKAFPDTNEIESPEDLLRLLNRESRLWDMIAVVEGDRVLGARHMTLLQSDHPERGAFVAGEHVYVDQSERKRGIAKSLIAHTEDLMRSWGVKLAISEQNDPNAMSPELLEQDARSGITTLQRVKFWKSRGYEGIDAPYVQPPLEEGKEAVHHLRIAIRRLDPIVPESLPTEGYIQMLKAYQSGWVRDIDVDPLVQEYCDTIRQEHPHRVPIVDLEQVRSCVKLNKDA